MYNKLEAYNEINKTKKVTQKKFKKGILKSVDL
jgi:hypothetical protein